MNIRLATINDVENIINLLLQIHEIHLKARPDWFKKKTLNFNYIKDIIEAKDGEIFIAEENDIIIGYCIINIRKYKNHEIFEDMENIEISEMCVDEKNRKRGVGKKLFDKVKIYGKEINAKNIELMVWDFNKEAIDFYEKMGMKTRIKRMEYKI